MGNKGNFDDDFNFDDDLFNNDTESLRGSASKGDNFDFGDDDAPFDEGDDFGGFDDMDNNDDFGDGGEEPTRRSRVFVILAAIMVLFILLGLGGLIFFATRPTGPQPFDLTSTSIAQFNATQQILLVQTQTQSAQFAAATETAVPVNATSTAEAEVAQTEQAVLAVTQTQEAALALTQAAQPTATPTLDGAITPTEDGGGVVTGGTPVGPADATATSIAATATALSAGGIGPALTQTAIALTPGGGIATATQSGGLTANDVLLTATALAGTLSPQTPQPDGTLGTGNLGDATRPPIFPTPTGQLPDTGLFDDISGVGSFGSMLLIAIGLVGVIAISRRLRRD